VKVADEADFDEEAEAASLVARMVGAVQEMG
jgi:hypothetical protein